MQRQPILRAVFATPILWLSSEPKTSSRNFMNSSLMSTK